MNNISTLKNLATRNNILASIRFFYGLSSVTDIIKVLKLSVITPVAQYELYESLPSVGEFLLLPGSALCCTDPCSLVQVWPTTVASESDSHKI